MDYLEIIYYILTFAFFVYVSVYTNFWKKLHDVWKAIKRILGCNDDDFMAGFPLVKYEVFTIPYT